MNEQELFLSAMLAPDVVGPIRLPRFGGGGRTGIGYDRTQFVMGDTGNFNTTLYRAIYNGVVAERGYAATGSATQTLQSSQLPGAQYPPPASVLDCSNTAGVIVVKYIGAPLNAIGEILIGTIPGKTSLTTLTFNALSVYPGVLRMPLSSLIENPLRVALRKISPAAYEFGSTIGEADDLEVPFVATSLMATSSSLSVEIYRAWEYRTVITTANIVPYDSGTSSHVKDTNALQEAQAQIVSYPNTVSTYNNEFVQKTILWASSKIPTLLDSGLNAFGQLTGYLANRHLAHMSMSPARNLLLGL